MKRPWQIKSLFVLVFFIAQAFPQTLSIHSNLSGTLTSMGSDTMNNLMSIWTEAFAKKYPNVKIQLEGKGSGTAPTALAAGAAQLGPMSRELTLAEKNFIEASCHCQVLGVPVALDAIAIFVNKKNPLQQLSFKQLDGLFGRNPAQGNRSLVYWNDIEAYPHKRFVQLYGRNAASGTHGFFREHVLHQRDFRDEVQEMLGSAALIQAIATDTYSLGYCGLGYQVPGVKPIALQLNDTLPYIAPNENTIQNGQYPLSRTLWIYTLHQNGKAPQDIPATFLRFVLSPEGQAIAEKEKYWSIPTAQRSLALKELN